MWYAAFNVAGTLVAIAVLAVTVGGLTPIGPQGWVQDVVNGSALLIGISISAVVARQRARLAVSAGD